MRKTAKKKPISGPLRKAEGTNPILLSKNFAQLSKILDKLKKALKKSSKKSKKPCYKDSDSNLE